MSVGNFVLAEENVNLPDNNSVQTALLKINNPDTNTGAQTRKLRIISGNTNLPMSFNVNYTNGDPAIASYELNGIVNSFNDTTGPAIPDSEADAFSVPGQYYSLFVDNGYLMLKNETLLVDYTRKSINIQYKAF